MGAPKNNKNNKKEITAGSFLQLRVKRSDKAMWVKAAHKNGNGKLAPWVVETLNAKCRADHSKPQND